MRRSSAWAGAFALLVGLVTLAGCSGGPSDDTPTEDVGVTDATDSGEVSDTDEEETGGADADPGPASFLCSPCSEDSDCGGADDRCVTVDGEKVCASGCDTSADNPCPADYRCASTSQDSTAGQCIPEELTCSNFCDDKTCGEGQVCDPILEKCRDRLGLCDTRCTINSVCGDGPEDRCLSLFEESADQQERICATGCNPQAETIDCPVDYQCVPTAPDEDPTRGVCFPLENTCVDRCSDKTCPEGENCNLRTGQCEPAQYGACQQGCQNNAQCGGQNDWCLNLYEGTGAHCYINCGGQEGSCPSGYRCAQLGGTTKSFCIPRNQRCDACHGTSCYPSGVCDPTSDGGMCVPRDTDCTKTGCPEGKVCDPGTTDCVAVGRSCSGDSWATDCDNTVTSCTTRRKGTSGTCERICAGDADCPEAGTSCVATNFRQMCMSDDLGGAQKCGTLRRDGTQIGEPCDNDGDCSGDADFCVEAGNIDGFCSASCQDDSDCSGPQRCGTGPQGNPICLPPQCDCAAGTGLPSGVGTNLQTALQEVGLDQCEVTIDADRAGQYARLSDTPLADDRLERWLELPLVGQRRVGDQATALDGANDSPESVLARTAEAAGLSISPTAGSYSFGGSNTELTQAVSQLITTAGGSPNTSQIETEAQNVPQAYRQMAAPIIAAVADAYTARDQAFTNAGWDATTRQQAFQGAHYLFLPGTASQTSMAPDLSKQAVRQTYGQFPDQKLAAAAGDLNATISKILSQTGDPSGWTNVDFVVDTPAGKVVLGGAGADTYDPSSNSAFSGDIAVIIDVGGDDTYRVPAGANTSVANGVSLVVDLGGNDTYSYEKVGSPRDTQHVLTSDGDGRKQPSGPISQSNGPVSLSTTARQGAGRIGIGMLHDYGTGDDRYESLRMSQGASVFGVGLLFDEGGDDIYDAEALAQGGAIGGLGVLWSAGGPDDYRVWHAGQGFGAAAGTGIAFDRDGSDVWEAVPGQASGDGVLYLSTADGGASNGNLAQGAGAGIASGSSTIGLAGGTGLLRDAAGSDTYTAGTSAQGIGRVRGIGLLAEAGGNDTYNGRALVQGAGRNFGGGILWEAGGDDDYNVGARQRSGGQGFGSAYGWGVLREMGGSDHVVYATPGGGVGFDGGFGFAFFEDGADQHAINAPSGWGSASNAASMGDPLYEAMTLGVFVEHGGDADTYDRPNLGSTSIGNDSDWLQPDPSTSVEKGTGIDD